MIISYIVAVKLLFSASDKIYKTCLDDYCPWDRCYIELVNILISQKHRLVQIRKSAADPDTALKSLFRNCLTATEEEYSMYESGVADARRIFRV